MFDKPSNVKRVRYVLFLLCALLIALEVFMPTVHPHFEIEAFPLFYGAFGFIAFTLLVLGAKFILRPLVKRDEDYYDK